MHLEELQLQGCAPKHSENKKVYIIDDDESVRSALKIFLATYGFHPEAFNSAEEFFSAVPNNAPGCLILDIHMPGLNGWSTMLRLSKSGSQRPVIVITADKNGGLRESALKVGAAGFLQKPLNGQELVDLINQAFLIKENA